MDGWMDGYEKKNIKIYDGWLDGWKKQMDRKKMDGWMDRKIWMEKIDGWLDG